MYKQDPQLALGSKIHNHKIDAFKCGVKTGIIIIQVIYHTPNKSPNTVFNILPPRKKPYRYVTSVVSFK